MTRDSNDQYSLKAIALTLTKADIDDYKRRHGPRWPVWRALPRVELWQAVALSLGIEPKDSLRDVAKRGALAHPMRFRLPDPPDLPAEFFERLNVCKRALSTDGPIRPQGSLYAGMLQNPCCLVLLAEVAAFLVLAEFTVPDEMRAGRPAPTAELMPAAAGTMPAHVRAEAQAAPEVTASAPADPERGKTKTRGWVLRRAALIQKHLHHWPTIERDLRDAAENKLSDAAKATTHGDWYEAAALEWATARGKLEGADGPAPVNSVFNLPGKKHTTKG